MERREDKLKRRQARRKKALVTAALLTLVAGALFGSWLNASPSGTSGSDVIARIRRELLSEEPAYGDPINMLLIGSDSRSGESARSDTLIFMRADFKRNRVYLVSIPRDTRVYIPGRGGDKINAAYAYGQASLAIRTVESFLGVDLNHYVEVDFQGFKKLVDTLGGIDITVAKGINDRTREFRMFIPKGRQHMNGDTALNYVRYRHGDSDFERAGRQQNFLRALAANIFTVKSIFKLPTLTGIFDENVGTDMSKREMLSLGGFMRQLPNDRIETFTLTGRSVMISGVSYVEPDRAAMNAILEAVEAGRSIKKMKSPGESDKMSMEKNRFSVLVLNGSGKTGLATRAKAKLSVQGFSLVRVGDADKFNYRQTEIRFPAAKRTEASRVRRLFFGEAKMVPLAKSRTGGIEIILGQDYYQYDRIRY